MNKDFIGALIFAIVIAIMALRACFNNDDEDGRG